MSASDPHELAQRVWDALQGLARERLARRPGGHLVESRLAEIELSLRVALDGSSPTPSFAARLVEAIDGVIDDAVQQAAAFQPGHAYCHRCRSGACAHSLPPSSRHVFGGYAPTGLPRWEDFAQFCLDRRHPQVDELYQASPALLAVPQDRTALYGGMVEAFQDPSFDLLGQVVAGFFPVRGRLEDGRSVLALSFQVGASRTRPGRMRLGLNLLGRTPAGEDLERLWDRHDELAWRKAVRWAQSALQTVETGPRHVRDPAMLAGRVDGILQGLARRLEREHRARSRRTRHAEARHATGNRPTGKALDDARSVRSDAVFVDQRSGAWIVLGQRGRTHFFTPEGRHVSSVRYGREAIERKIEREIWRLASTAEGDRFLEKLGG